MINDCSPEIIHEASLHMLNDVGVRLEHDDIHARLLRAGAQPGLGTYDVKLPREMVQEYLRLVPPDVTLSSRAGTSIALTAESPAIYWTNPAMYLCTGASRRELTRADLADVARLCDSLENVQGIIGMAMHDVSPPCRDFVGLRIIAEHSRKHVRVLAFSPTGMDAVLAMHRVFPGPWLSVGFTAHGPLRWTHLALEIFAHSAGRRIPTTINGEPMAGVSGPVTLAGSAAVGNAEILAGIVVNQLLEPGRPLIYNLGLAHTFDMKHATAVTGGPENALFAAISAAMGRFYSIPSASWVSTEALFEDEQAAMEKMFGFHTHAENGVGIIWGMGQLESELTMSLAQLVIDNEMINYARRYARGCHVGEAEIPLELIRTVGITGNYLDTDHTFENYRSQLYEPTILNRRARADGAVPLCEAARRRVDALLSTDSEGCIAEDDLAELHRIEDYYSQQLLG